MKEVYYDDGVVKKTFAYDRHIPGRFYREVTTNEKPITEANKKLRSSRLMEQDKRNPLCEGDIIAFAFRFSSHAALMIAQSQEPDLFRQVMHGTDQERLRAAERLSILFPRNVLTTRRRDARRRTHAR